MEGAISNRQTTTSTSDLNSPEVQKILKNPAMKSLLELMQKNPQVVEILKNPAMKSILELMQKDPQAIQKYLIAANAGPKEGKQENLDSELSQDIRNDISKYEKKWLIQLKSISELQLAEINQETKVRCDFQSRHDWPSEEKILSFISKDERIKDVFEGLEIPKPTKLYNHKLALDLWAKAKIMDFAMQKVGYRTVGWRIKVCSLLLFDVSCSHTIHISIFILAVTWRQADAY